MIYIVYTIVYTIIVVLTVSYVIDSKQKVFEDCLTLAPLLLRCWTEGPVLLASLELLFVALYVDVLLLVVDIRGEIIDIFN